MGELYNPFPKLPKNIRQIGESDQVLRFYMEDYVNTYLKRLYPTGMQTIRVGVLLGNVEYNDGTPYVFVDGAMEMEDVETDHEKVILSESSWKKVYQRIEENFPKRTIQGWFLCGGPGSQLSPLNYWKQHGQYFAGKNQLMYLNHGLDGEESIYITSEDGFYRLKGHCIYYERNQMMQDYMITRKDVRRVESSSQDTVIKDFRSRLSAKKEQVTIQNRTVNVMGMLCGMLTVAVLAGGVALINNYTKMQQMESVLVSVLPDNIKSWDEYRELQDQDEDFVIEEVAGSVYPTKNEKEALGETGQSFTSETMESGQEVQEDSAEPESASGDTLGAMVNTDSSKEHTGVSDKGSSSDGNSGSAESQTEPNVNLIGMEKEMGQGDEGGPVSKPIDYKAAAANGYKIYEVGSGETLYGICWKQYGSLAKLSEICELNHLQNVDRILAGQKLILP